MWDHCFHPTNQKSRWLTGKTQLRFRILTIEIIRAVRTVGSFPHNTINQILTNLITCDAMAAQLLCFLLFPACTTSNISRGRTERIGMRLENGHSIFHLLIRKWTFFSHSKFENPHSKSTISANMEELSNDMTFVKSLDVEMTHAMRMRMRRTGELLNNMLSTRAGHKFET
jgi:hypothetical protein